MAKKTKLTKKSGGPFLAAAVFCESFLEDNSGKVSAVGIMDGCTFLISNDAPPDVPSKSQPVQIMQNLLIIFRSGDSPGKHRLRLVVEQPDGKRNVVLDKDVGLSKPAHGGLNIKTQAAMRVHSAGIFWIDVYLDGKRFTRMPLNVAYQRFPQATTGQATGTEKPSPVR